MSRQSAIATLTHLNTLNSNVVEYADSSEWSLKDLRNEWKNCEEITTMMQIDQVIEVRNSLCLTEAELDQIAGV